MHRQMAQKTWGYLAATHPVTMAMPTHPGSARRNAAQCWQEVGVALQAPPCSTHS